VGEVVFIDLDAGHVRTTSGMAPVVALGEDQPAFIKDLEATATEIKARRAHASAGDAEDEEEEGGERKSTGNRGSGGGLSAAFRGGINKLKAVGGGSAAAAPCSDAHTVGGLVLCVLAESLGAYRRFVRRRQASDDAGAGRPGGGPGGPDTTEMILGTGLVFDKKGFVQFMQQELSADPSDFTRAGVPPGSRLVRDMAGSQMFQCFVEERMADATGGKHRRAGDTFHRVVKASMEGGEHPQYGVARKILRQLAQSNSTLIGGGHEFDHKISSLAADITGNKGAWSTSRDNHADVRKTVTSSFKALCRATFDVTLCSVVMGVIWERLVDSANGKNWRHAYKGLALVVYLLHYGSENVAAAVLDHLRELSGALGYVVDQNLMESVLGGVKDKASRAMDKAAAKATKLVSKLEKSKFAKKAFKFMDKKFGKKEKGRGDSTSSAGSATTEGGGPSYEDRTAGERARGRNSSRSPSPSRRSSGKLMEEVEKTETGAGESVAVLALWAYRIVHDRQRLKASRRYRTETDATNAMVDWGGSPASQAVTSMMSKIKRKGPFQVSFRDLHRHLRPKARAGSGDGGGRKGRLQRGSGSRGAVGTPVAPLFSGVERGRGGRQVGGAVGPPPALPPRPVKSGATGGASGLEGEGEVAAFNPFGGDDQPLTPATAPVTTQAAPHRRAEPTREASLSDAFGAAAEDVFGESKSQGGGGGSGSSGGGFDAFAQPAAATSGCGGTSLKSVYLCYHW
jgi:epsin